MKKNLMVLSVVILSVMVISGVYSQTKIGLMGIGATIGYISPEGDVESTLGFGGRADLGTIFSPKFGFLAEFLYWSKGYDTSMYGGTHEWSYSQIYISALTKYGFGKDEKSINPYIGGGIGLVLGKVKQEWDYDVPYFGHESGSTSDSPCGAGRCLRES